MDDATWFKSGADSDENELEECPDCGLEIEDCECSEDDEEIDEEDDEY